MLGIAIKKEYKRFIWKQFKKLFGNYDDVQLLSDSADVWKKYYIKNYDNIENLLEKLISGTDEKSKEHAKLIFDRNVFLMPWRKTYGCYLYNLDKIYADFEFEDQNRTIDKQKYKLPQDDQYVKGVFLHKNGIVDIEDVAKKLIEGRDVLDCGAYVGDSAIIFNEYKPKNIYCFEPGSENLKMIDKTAELNNMVDVIKPVPLGIAKSKGKLYFSVTASGFSTVTDIKPNENSEEIEVTSIDAFVSENNLNPSVIKMDIEGAEYDAVQGAVETIKKFKPILLISIYHTPVDFFEIKPLIESIADYNFKIRKIESNFLCVDLILIGYPKE